MTRLGVVLLLLVTWVHALPVDKDDAVLKELLHLIKRLDRPNRNLQNNIRKTTGSCASASDSTPVEFIGFNEEVYECGIKGNEDSRRRNVLLDLLKRIVGGQNAEQYEYPWMVAMIPTSGSSNHNSGGPECGGSLISPQWVLTAAHCFTKENDNGQIVWENEPSQWKFIFNTNNPVNYLNNDGEARDAAAIYIHGHFDKDSSETNDDIALVKLCNPIDYTIGTPICLPNYDPAKEFDEEECTVTGWGATSNGGAGSPMNLMEVDLRVYDPEAPNSDCPALDNTLCAKGNGMDSCQGDSGGPLTCGPGQDSVLSDDASHVQIGIVSHGTGENGCAASDTWGVYVNPFAYRDWICDIVSDESDSWCRF